MSELTGADIQELEDLQELTRLRGWRVLKNLLNNHRIYCIEQAHKYLRKHEDRKAGEWLAKSEEPQRLLSLIQDRRGELSEKQKGEK